MSESGLDSVVFVTIPESNRVCERSEQPSEARFHDQTGSIQFDVKPFAIYTDPDYLGIFHSPSPSASGRFYRVCASRWLI